MRVHPRSTGPRGRERKEGGREGAAQGERSVLGERGGGRVAEAVGGWAAGARGEEGGVEQEEKTDEVSRPLDW